MRLSQEIIQRMINGRSGGGAGGGGSFDPSALAGFATQAWTEENYISKTFFNELFVIHKKVTTVVMDGETEISRTVTTNSVFAPNEIPGTTETTDEETGYVTTVTTEVASIESKKGFWTNYFLSALGLNSEGGGGGGLTLNEPLATINVSGLADHPTSGGQTIVWNGSAWVYGTAGGGTGTVTGVKVGDITYSPVNGIVSIPAYPTSLAWSAVTGKPTTIAGYGITDAKIENGTITLGGNTITPLTSFTETDPTVPAWAKQANKPSYSFSEITNKPTTLSGYGITDAKIENGVITLGSNTITPVTSVAMTVPTGFSISGSPISKTGTLGLSYANGYEGFTTELKNKINEIYSWFELDSDGNVKTKDKPNNGGHRGFWTESFVSALGLNSGGGGGGDVSALTDLVDVAISNPTNGQVLKYNSSTGKWYNGTDEGVTTLSWSQITGKPETATRWPSFSEVTSKPTTISGYGITDAKIENGTITLGGNTITPLTSFTETDPTVPAWAKQANKPSYSFSEITNKPTTLSGYGITDAKIQNGTITLGSNSITPVTSLDGYATESWVRGIFEALDRGTSIQSRATSSSHYNLNALVDPGVYTITNNDNAAYFDNRPYNSNTAFRIVVYVTRDVSRYIAQRFAYSGSSTVYERYSSDGGSTWGSWIQVSGDISDMATQTWVGQQISDMATMTWVGQQGFALASNVYSKSDADAKFMTFAAFENLFNAIASDGSTKVNYPYEANVASIKAKFGLWTEQYLSALGLNSSGSGNVSALTDLVDVAISSPTNGQVLKYNSSTGKWYNGTDEGVTTLSWNNITNKPETATRWPSFSEVTSKPTTISGYGITDAKIQNGTITLGSNSITPVTSLDGYATESWVRGTFEALDRATNIQSQATSSSHYNLNLLVDPGVYTISNNANAAYFDNRPYNSNTAFRIVVYITRYSTGNYVAQKFAYSGSSNTYERYSSDGGSSWGSWIQVSGDLSIFATQTWVNQQISDMATQTWVSQQISDMATKTWVGQQGFALASNVYSKTDADAKFMTIAAFENLFNAIASDGSTKINHPYASSVASIKAKFGLWTEQYLSALGLNSSGSGNVSALTDLVDVAISSPTNGQVLKYNATTGKWYNGNDEGVTTLSWNNITNKPETATRWPSFSEVTSKPTTISGYGITDAKIQNGTITLGSNTITPVTSLDGYATESWVRGTFEALDRATNIQSQATSSSHYNLNALVSPGVYTITNNANAAYFDNRPVNTNTAFRIVVYMTRYGSSYLAQRFSYSGSSNLYERHSTNGGDSWGSWTQIAGDLSVYASASRVSTIEGYFDSSGAANKAVVLKTSRTLWGQSFDGSANVTGTIHVGAGDVEMNNNTKLTFKDSGGTLRESVRLYSNNKLHVGYGSAGAGYDTYINGNNIYLSYGTAHTTGMILTSGGNIGIGTASPSAKLDVSGSISCTSIVIGGITITADNSGIHVNSAGLYADTYISALGLSDSGSGNVSALTDLVDVAISSPTNGQVLKYNSSTHKWYNGTDEGVSSVSWDNITGKPTLVNSVVKGTATSGGAITTSNGVVTVQFPTAPDLSNYVTLNGAQTISAKKTFSVQQAFTVAQGTSPFTVTSTTKVANLNADQLDGIDSSGFGRLFTYELGYGKSLRITFSGTHSAAIWGRSSQGFLHRIVLLGNGYSSREHWKCVDIGGNVTWAVSSTAQSVEVKYTYTAGTFYVSVLAANGTVTFTEITDLSGTAVTDRLASLTDNVASATKLETARTLWGRSFDGTANVSGALTDVTSITMGGSISGCTNINSLLYLDNSSQAKVGTSSTWTYTHSGSTITPKLYVSGEIGASGGLWAGFAELYHATPYIDFHYNSSTYDYTSRIIENTSGVLTIQAKSSSSDKAAGLVIGSVNGTNYLQVGTTNTNTTNKSYVQIGNIQLVYDSSNNALKVQTSTGGVANFYALGAISALGISSNTMGEISGDLMPSTNAAYSIGSSSKGWNSLYLNDGDGGTINIYPDSGDAWYSCSGKHQFEDPINVSGTGYFSGKLSIAGTNSNSDKLYVNGSMRSSGISYASSHNNTSDARLKNIIGYEEVDVETIAHAPLIKFTWKDGDSRVHIGTTAQYWLGTELHDVIEQNDYLSMDYATTALAGVIGVARKVMTHEEEIAALKRRIGELKNEIETLKAA